MRRKTRYAFAHDYLTQTGGAERVALAAAQGLEVDRIYTTFYNPHNTFDGFSNYKVDASMKRWSKLSSKDIRYAYPLMRRAVARITPDDCDVVVCSSSGWAHAIETTVPKVVYFHSPARWLYEPEDYFKGLPKSLRVALTPNLKMMKTWDQEAAKTITTMIANSSVVADRVRRVYGVQPRVIHPPVTTTTETKSTPIDGVSKPFFLTIARGRGYKNTEAIEKAAEISGIDVVVAGGPAPKRINSGRSTVYRLGRVSDSELQWLYSNCVGLVAAAHEDFGLTPIEANAHGRPVVALKHGGYLDSMIESTTAVFFSSVNAPEIAAAMHECIDRRWDENELVSNAERFNLEGFTQRLRETVEEALPK